MRCDCGNVATVDGMCDWCAAHVECVRPDGVTFYLAHLTGEPRLRCVGCDQVWGYWECVCESEHVCQPA